MNDLNDLSDTLGHGRYGLPAVVLPLECFDGGASCSRDFLSRHIRLEQRRIYDTGIHNEGTVATSLYFILYEPEFLALGIQCPYDGYGLRHSINSRSNPSITCCDVWVLVKRG